MRKSVQIIVEIIRKEFHQIRQDKRMLGVSIVAPVLQVILLGYAATTDIANADLVVCDMDKTEESRNFVKAFTASGYFVQSFSVSKPDEADSYIEEAKASVILVVPYGFGEKLLRRETAPVQAILDGADANTANLLLGYARQIISSYSQDFVSASIAPSGRTSRILAEPRVWFNPDLRSSNYMVPGVVTLVLMVITMTLTSLGIVKEKENGTLEQLMVTPIRPFELIIGKLIPFVIIGFIDVGLVLSIARYWFDVPMEGHLLTLYVLSGLFILTTLGLGLFISTIAKSQQQAMLIAQFFFLMPFMFLSGFASPIANMPPVIQAISYLIPLRYFLEIVRGVLLKGVGLAELWPQAVSLLVFGVATLSLSVMRFQKKLE